MASKTRAVLLLAMMAMAMTLAAAQASDSSCPADCESQAQAVQGSSAAKDFVTCAKQAKAAGQKVDPCCSKVAGYADLARKCANCPDAIPRLSAWLSGQGLDAGEVIGACSAQLSGR